MNKNASTNAEKTPQTSPEAPCTTLIQWSTGSPPLHRGLVLRGLLESPGSNHRLGILTESQGFRLFPRC